jgi:hypothetical protein
MKSFKFILMTMSLVTLTIALSGVVNAKSFHHHYWPNCIRENWILLKESILSQEQCKLDKPLKLTDAITSFPKIDVPSLKVRYWEARFIKNVHKLATYEHNYLNTCVGMVVDSEIISLERTEPKFFTLKNPNLDPSITETYKLSPMTNEEASRAFEDLKKECEFDQ